MSTLLASLARVRESLRNTPPAKLAEIMERVKAMNLKGPKYSEIFNEHESQSIAYYFERHHDGIATTQNALLSLERSFCL
jgi:hypothetical protein